MLIQTIKYKIKKYFSLLDGKDTAEVYIKPLTQKDILNMLEVMNQYL